MIPYIPSTRLINNCPDIKAEYIGKNTVLSTDSSFDHMSILYLHEDDYSRKVYAGTPWEIMWDEPIRFESISEMEDFIIDRYNKVPTHDQQNGIDLRNALSDAHVPAQFLKDLISGDCMFYSLSDNDLSNFINSVIVFAPEYSDCGSNYYYKMFDTMNNAIESLPNIINPLYVVDLKNKITKRVKITHILEEVI